MKKRVLTRKLIMSISTAAMTAICLGTSTYAWFSQNEVVWTEETDFNLDFYSGLLISFDGVNYHQDVTKEQLYKQVTGLDDETEATNAFKNIKLDGVSPVHEDKKIQYDNNGYARFTYDAVDEETNLHTSRETMPIQVKQPDNSFIVEETPIVNNKYLRFNLWFKLANGGVPSASSPKYNLVFTQMKDDDDKIVKDTYVKSKAGAQEVKLLNKLRSKASAKVPVDTTVTDEYTDFYAGEKIKVDGSNALRVGVGTYNNDQTPKSMIVYEPVNNNDLGSAAVVRDNYTDDAKHNPENNAMYTYYNNFFSQKFTSAAEDGEAFYTHSDFLDGTSLGVFESVQDSNNPNIYTYNEIKLTMYIWLEGWDADYFYGITSSDELSRAMQSSFVFTFQEI